MAGRDGGCAAAGTAAIRVAKEVTTRTEITKRCSMPQPPIAFAGWLIIESATGHVKNGGSSVSFRDLPLSNQQFRNTHFVTKTFGCLDINIEDLRSQLPPGSSLFCNTCDLDSGVFMEE